MRLRKFLPHQATEKDELLEQAVQKLLQEQGMHSISSLVVELQIAERRLERLFNRHVGISPERFANSLRLNHFIGLCHQSNRTSFTHLAHECGFAGVVHTVG